MGENPPHPPSAAPDTAIRPGTPPSAPGFQQRLGLFDATMLVAGSMVGSGIFIVSVFITQDVGSAGWLLAIWGLTGALTIVGALSYAELAAMMPRAGGQYVFLREAYSPLWGFLYGWTSFLVIQTGFIAAVSVAFAKFLGVLVPAVSTDHVLWSVPMNVNLKLPVPWMEQPEWPSLFKREAFSVSAGQLVAVGVVAVLTLLNCRGVQEGKWVQNIFTVAKVLGLVLLIVLGLTVALQPATLQTNCADLWGGIWATKQYESVHHFMPLAGVAALMVMGGAMVGALFSADAWNNVTFAAAEIRNPRRNLPWSLALGTGLVIVLYLLANVAYLAALPLHGDKKAAEAKEAAAKEAATPEEAQTLRAEAAFTRGIDHARDDRVGTAVLERASPNFGVPLMAVAIMISTFGCVNGLVLMGARLYYAMAQDRLFFQSVGQLNGRGVPAVGLVLQGLWSVVLIFSGTYGDLLDYIIFAALLFYVLTVSGLFVLRRKMPNAERPYRAFGYPVLPALYVVVCALIMLDLLIVKPVYSWPSFIIVLTGIPVYLFWRRSARAAA
jgi:APA family basic amino acid/polyamine antiporter